MTEALARFQTTTDQELAIISYSRPLRALGVEDPLPMLAELPALGASVRAKILGEHGFPPPDICESAARAARLGWNNFDGHYLFETLCHMAAFPSIHVALKEALAVAPRQAGSVAG